MGVYLPYTKLPSEYQEVEYIQSSGTQRIDTGVVVTGTIGFEIDFKGLDTINGTGHAIIGGRYRGGQQELGLSTYYLYTGGLVAYNTSNADAKMVKNQRQQCSLKNGVFTDCDGGVTTFTLSSFTTTANLQIFAMRDVYSSAYSDYASVVLYSLKLYDGITLVRDFVPCYRIADGVIGMYDLVNDVFYTNSGTGTFTKGADVFIMSELKNAYIGEYVEGWQPGANTLAYFPFTEDSLDKTGNYTLNSSGTKETIGYKFNTPTTVTGGSIPGVNFIGFWYNTHDTNLAGNYDLCAYAGHGYVSYNPGHNQTSIRGKMVIFGDASYNLGGSIDINKYDSWHYLARSYDGSKIIVCDDGVVSTLCNNGGYNFGNGFTLNNYGTGGSGSTARTTFSELIIEDTGWSSEDMTKYYNDTKSNYGL